MEQTKKMVELGSGSVFFHQCQGQGLAQDTNAGQPPDLQTTCSSLFKQGVQGTANVEWGKYPFVCSLRATAEDKTQLLHPSPFNFTLR